METRALWWARNVLTGAKVAHIRHNAGRTEMTACNDVGIHAKRKCKGLPSRFQREVASSWQENIYKYLTLGYLVSSDSM